MIDWKLVQSWETNSDADGAGDDHGAILSPVGIGYNGSGQRREEAGGLPGGHVLGGGDIAVVQHGGEVRDEVVQDPVERQAVTELGTYQKKKIDQNERFTSDVTNRACSPNEVKC